MCPALPYVSLSILLFSIIHNFAISLSNLLFNINCKILHFRNEFTNQLPVHSFSICTICTYIRDVHAISAVHVCKIVNMIHIIKIIYSVHVSNHVTCDVVKVVHGSKIVVVGAVAVAVIVWVVSLRGRRRRRRWNARRHTAHLTVGPAIAVRMRRNGRQCRRVRRLRVNSAADTVRRVRCLRRSVCGGR